MTRLGGLSRVGLALTAAALTLAASPAMAKPKRSAAATRWYGADPHVPLALVTAAGAGTAKRIDTIGHAGEMGAAASRAHDAARNKACANWARVGSNWSAVDRWGQLLGTKTLRAREYYEPTGCYEASFPDDPQVWSSPFTPRRIVVYASGAFRPRPSAEWTPSEALRREHEGFVTQLTKAVVNPSSACNGKTDAAHALLPLAGRTMFFRMADPGDPNNQVAPRDRHFAVSGGCALIIAERTADGRWYAPYVNASLANENWANSRAYLPFAVFDMNDDGWPEIVSHESEGSGEFYGDVVISRDRNGDWQLVARSVGGSTA